MTNTNIHGNATHNGTHEPLFKIWRSIRARCYQKCSKSYKDYGGRGIVLCDRWQDYAKFREDLMPLYVPGLEIDRIDNDKGYEPGNIKWSTHKEQSRNRRSSFMITAFGKTQALAAWAEEYGQPWFRIQQRIRILGWNAERAITQPSRGWGPNNPKTA